MEFSMGKIGAELSLRKFFVLRLALLMTVGILAIFTLTSLTFKEFVEKNYSDKIHLAHDLFVQNIRTDVLLGAFHQVDQKCESFFRSTEMLSIQVLDSKMTPICDLKIKKFDDLGMKVVDFIYFNEEKTKIAATIESHFNLDKLNLYRKKIIWGTSLVVFVMAALSMLLISRATKKITKPIEDLVASFQSTNFDVISHLSIPKGIYEIKTLYAGVQRLVQQISEANRREQQNIKHQAFASVGKQVSHDIRINRPILFLGPNFI